MKKVYVNGNGKLDTSPTGEAFALYYGIEAVYGEYILETCGNPTCLNELEEAGDEAEALRNAIDALVDDPATPWQACDAGDEAYVSQWLRIWGLG